MPRFRIRLSIPSVLPPRRTRESIDRFMGRAFRFAVRSAIQAHINQIHIQSGMARGTFLFISRFVRAGVNFPTNSGFTYYHRKGSQAQPKSAQLGASFSTADSRGAAEDRFMFKFPRYVFQMDTALRYFNIEDQVRWNFSDAFEATMERKLEEFIDKNGPSLIGEIFPSVSLRGTS